MISESVHLVGATRDTDVYIGLVHAAGGVDHAEASREA